MIVLVQRKDNLHKFFCWQIYCQISNLPNMRHSRINLPDGFQTISKQTGGRPRTFIICTKKIHHQGEIYSCDWIKRKDYLPKDPESEEYANFFKHRCTSQKIDTYFKAKFTEIVSPHEHILKTLASFTGKYNLSLSAVVSNAMTKLIKEAFRIGQQHPNQEPEDVLPSLNRKKITKVLLARGEELYGDCLNQYKKLKYVALSIDAGKLGNHNYLDAIISNALLNVQPLLYKAYLNFDGTTKNYREKVFSMIQEIEENGLIVTGIVCDNLRVQTSGIMQAFLAFPDKFHFECNAHALHNGIKVSFSNDAVLQHFLDSLEIFVLLMNKKSVLAVLKLATPKRCITRWTNIYDICSFIAKHYETYLNFFANEEFYEQAIFTDSYTLELVKETISTIVPLLCLLLYFPKKLSMKVENDRTTCGMTYGLEKAALIKMEQLAIQYPPLTHYINILRENIQNRLTRSSNGLIELVASVLTPEGRELFLMEAAKNPPDILKNFVVEHFSLENENDAEILSKYYSLYINEPDFSLLDRNLQIFKEHEASVQTARAQRRADEINQKTRKFEFYLLQAQLLENRITNQQYLDLIEEKGLSDFLVDGESDSDEDNTHEEEQEEVFSLNSEAEEEDFVIDHDPLEELIEAEAIEEITSARYEPQIDSVFQFDYSWFFNLITVVACSFKLKLGGARSHLE